MIYKQLSQQPKYVRILFELPAGLWADRIFLVGDFTKWRNVPIPFTQERDGMWRVAVDLPAAADYAFRYLVDGYWHSDYHADGWADGPDGHRNSIVKTTLAFW